MKINILHNEISEKKLFYIFLAVHLIVWSCIGLIRTVMPTDTLEGIYWGSLYDLGTPKHPPLAAWLTYLAYIPFKCDFLVYLLSQAFIILGFVYIYRIAKFFFDENKAMLSVILLEGCWGYSYITGYYGFNPDVVMFLALPAITFYFINCMKFNKTSDWIKLGVIVGVSFLNKYQTIMLIVPMAIWAFIFNRSVYKQIKIYMAMAIAFLICIPHLLWLIKYDFFPILYFEEELSPHGIIGHITAPLMFMVSQLGAIAGTLVIFILLKLVFKSPFKLRTDCEKKKFWFLILMGGLPLALELIMGVQGGAMRGRWGYCFWFMLGIMLFYFFPIRVTRKEFVFTLKSAYAVMLIVFISLGTLLAVEKNYRSRYPVAKVFDDIKLIWAANFDTPLKYLGGYIEWTLPLTIYGDTHPKCMLDTHGYPDPWISVEERQKNGVFIIDRTPKSVIRQTKKSCPYLPEDYEITPHEYKFTLTNALNMPREYTVYYFIVPPQG